jgi:two-component system, cell cycle sensor histidine kinase and response regulator CckA
MAHVAGVPVIAPDVSPLGLAEQALLDSRARLRALFESDLVGIIFGDVRGGIQEANDKFLSIVGYSRDDLRAGLRWSELTAPEFQELNQARVAEAHARGACAPYEKQYIRKDGTRVWALVGYAFLEPDREQSVAFVLDIGARKVAEDELRRADERFAKLFHSSMLAVAIAEAESGRFIDVNERCAEFLGYAPEEMIGRTVHELGLWSDPAERARLIAAISTGACVSNQEVAFRRKSGEVRPALISIEGITLTGISKPLDMVIMVDITERKRLETQSLHAQKMEAIGRLAGGVAHDFNNSLGVILGYTELLMREAEGVQKGKLEQILKATHRASGLTRQLLAFSRKQTVDPKVLDLNALLSDLDRMLARLIGEDIDLVIVPGADLGRVRADPGQVEQVVMNLCLNARDAMLEGGILRIETANAELDAGHAARHEPMAAGPYVMLSVGDTGCGIEKPMLSKIFEPFFTTKEPGKGTGLGLALAYGMVKQAGGNLWVYSEPGHGSVFKIYLPRVDEAGLTTQAPPSAMPSKGWETVLLVEDEGTLRALAREILEGHGYVVLEAADANQALQVARRHPGTIHLLFTDVVMPGMNGRALAESLRAERPGVRVLYTSGYTDDVIAQSGVRGSDNHFLEKPFTAVALLEHVRKALGDLGEGEKV